MDSHRGYDVWRRKIIAMMIRRSTSRKPRKRSLEALIAVILCLSLVASGCHAGTSKAAATTGHGTSAASPPGLPSPNAGPDAALLPPAAVTPAGTPQAQATVLAKAVAAGGPGALAALRKAVTLSGIALIEEDGTPVDAAAKPIAGLEMPIGELLQVVDQNTYQHGRMASDIASAFNALDSDKDSVTSLQSDLINSIITQWTPNSPGMTKTGAFLGSFIVALGQQATPASDMTVFIGNDVRFTGLQTWFILLDMASAFLIHGAKALASASPKADLASTDGLADGTRTVLAANAPCSPDPDSTAAKILDFAALAGSIGAGGVAGTEFEGFLGLIGGATEKNAAAASAADVAAVVGVVLSLVKLMVETFALATDFKVLGGQPLVRTKDKGQYDEKRSLQVTLMYHIGAGQYANCLRTALNTAGLDFSVPNNGPLVGAELTWHMYNDPAGAIYNPLTWYKLPEAGSNDSEQDTYTDTNGESKTGVESQIRYFQVPPNAPPQMKTVYVVVGISLKKSTFYNDIMDSLSVLTGGVLAGAASFIISLLERMEIMSVGGSISVKDWQTDFRINSSGKYANAGSTLQNVTKCDGIAGTWNFRGGLSFTLDENGQGEAESDGFKVNVTFTDGDPPTIKFEGDGIIQEYTVIPGDFCEHETH
jgi:hypothetical protein